MDPTVWLGGAGEPPISLMGEKQSARWQHLSRLKASAFLFDFFLLGVKKHNSLYLRLVSPSSG
jgi:hypothetical protein